MEVMCGSYPRHGRNKSVNHVFLLHTGHAAALEY
jgi:hypothetical protein